jgi:hypothetical protein
LGNLVQNSLQSSAPGPITRGVEIAALLLMLALAAGRIQYTAIG